MHCNFIIQFVKFDMYFVSKLSNSTFCRGDQPLGPNVLKRDSGITLFNDCWALLFKKKLSRRPFSQKI